jgi:hypothetical protein
MYTVLHLYVDMGIVTYVLQGIFICHICTAISLIKLLPFLYIQFDHSSIVLDNGYFDNNAYKILIPTAWIPLLDATETNGCMEVGRK